MLEHQKTGAFEVSLFERKKLQDPLSNGAPMSDRSSAEDLLGFTAEIVSALVSNNPVSASDLPRLITEVHQTLAALDATGAAPAPTAPPEPAVPVKKSITPDYLICLEDGKKLKMLKRHLHSSFGLTPEAYRAKWDLPSDYPMVAPNYAKRRSQLARQFGLGRPAKA